jgi:hypothetical protein
VEASIPGSLWASQRASWPWARGYQARPYAAKPIPRACSKQPQKHRISDRSSKNLKTPRTDHKPAQNRTKKRNIEPPRPQNELETSPWSTPRDWPYPPRWALHRNHSKPIRHQTSSKTNSRGIEIERRSNEPFALGRAAPRPERSRESLPSLMAAAERPREALEASVGRFGGGRRRGEEKP